MNERNNKVEQKADGQNIQQISAVGENITANISTFMGLPLQSIIASGLIIILLLQWLANIGLICERTFNPDNAPAITLAFSVCCPGIFGIPALFGIILGIQQHEKKIAWLGLASLLSSLIPTFAVFIFLSPLILAVFIAIAQKLGLPLYK
jgi:hypothetical protein